MYTDSSAYLDVKHRALNFTMSDFIEDLLDTLDESQEAAREGLEKIFLGSA